MNLVMRERERDLHDEVSFCCANLLYPPHIFVLEAGEGDGSQPRDAVLFLRDDPVYIEKWKVSLQLGVSLSATQIFIIIIITW